MKQAHPEETLDMENLRQWIGRDQVVHDTVTPRLLAEFNSCFGNSGERTETEVQPGELLGLHWCLATDAAPLESLDIDGHIARGDFLPPVPLPQRMWAGGQLEFHDDLRPGDPVTRRSVVQDITAREGRSGSLCFVSVRHEFSTPRGMALTERHDIVYRDHKKETDLKKGTDLFSLRGTDLKSVPLKENKSVPFNVPLKRKTMAADPVLLFRYSALTFNSHRIHYDRNYCKEEGYPGLLVHGPLQATLLMRFGASIRSGASPRLFEYRAIQPLYDGQVFSLNASEVDEGLELWIEDTEGCMTMTAKELW